ncbi:hypothetical protein KDA_17360 [Dictyobacter alpinus]|uniref:Uncharacterized protein n=1 Tax=Dictyobacter alpinus TaxID=2014873 RepID=A0A402B4I3_9CHLR|nr:hypothetical protein KDA_17360 [Dictyobacter alpinus]
MVVNRDLNSRARRRQPARGLPYSFRVSSSFASGRGIHFIAEKDDNMTWK